MDTEMVAQGLIFFVYAVAVSQKFDIQFEETKYAKFIPLVITLSKHVFSLYATLGFYLYSKIEKKTTGDKKSKNEKNKKRESL